MAKKVQSRVQSVAMGRIRCTQVCTVDGLGTHIAAGAEFEIDPGLAQRLVDGGSFEFVTVAVATAEE